MWLRFFILIILLISGLSAKNIFASSDYEETREGILQFYAEDFVNEDYFIKRTLTDFVNAQELETIKPYLLPEKHRMKKQLDVIFTYRGILASTEAMEKVGFEIICHRKGRGLVVAKHPLLKNYLIKTYLDTATHVDWMGWVRRIEGAKRVQRAIDSHRRHKRYVKVPKKWIYHIPEGVRGLNESHVPREFLLLVQDMKILSKAESVKLYKTVISHKALKSLYYIINESGYSDCHIGNLPFSKDGKIAFIDTEHGGRWPVHPEWLTRWFSLDNQAFWKDLLP